jgi:hypothetical protein
VLLSISVLAWLEDELEVVGLFFVVFKRPLRFRFLLLTTDRGRVAWLALGVVVVNKGAASLPLFAIS